MEKNIKDYLHLYLGCEMLYVGTGKPAKSLGKKVVLNARNFEQIFIYSGIDRKPILRPLSDMNDEEIIELFLLTFLDDFEDKPTIEDCDAEMFFNDDGDMVDADVAVGANLTCRCYEGQIAIRQCGSIHFYNADGDLDYFYNAPKAYTFLLSKHFDLFGLIEAGLAIDATTLK